MYNLTEALNLCLELVVACLYADAEISHRVISIDASLAVFGGFLSRPRLLKFDTYRHRAEAMQSPLQMNSE